jgi:hypothetical protein
MIRLSTLVIALATVLAMSAQSPDAAGAKPNTYAQKLVDQALARHSEVIILVFHVSNINASDYPIIASNIGRYGKKADEDDLRAIHTGKTNLEVNPAGNHFEVEMPLRDTSKKVVGAMGVVFNYKAGDDKEVLHKKAQLVRSEVEKKITSLAQLMGLRRQKLRQL